MKPTEQIVVFVEDIPNLVDVGIEVGFHDQLVESDMDIAEHLVMDDLVTIGDELCGGEHLVVSNEIASIEILAYVSEELHIASDMDFVASDVEFVVASVDSLIVDMDEGLLLNHYVQFVLGCDHPNGVFDIYLILMFQWMEHRWLVFRFVLLTLMK